MVLNELYNIIIDRIEKKPQGSYTVQLVSKGLSHIVKKFNEEAIEVAIAVLSESKDRIISEIADLIYHLLVLMAIKNVTPDDVINELKRRRR